MTTCNPAESVYCNRLDCPTCGYYKRQEMEQARQKLYKCDQCGKYREYKEDFYFVRRYEDDEPNRICSPSCLTEWAWGEKERQQKLSKSRNV